MLSEKSFYTVSGVGKDITLLGDSASVFDAVIYHDVKGGTFVDDCGSGSGMFMSFTRTVRPRTGYLLEVGEKISFGDPRDQCSTKAMLMDAAAR